MTELTFTQDEGESFDVDLKNPYLAALLAWLIPGAGHFYQGRIGKGILFFVCVMGTFWFGVGLARGRAVYASVVPGDVRWQFALQIACGANSFPAVAQALQTQDGSDPLWVLCERFSEDFFIEEYRFKKINEENLALAKRDAELFRNINFDREMQNMRSLKDGFMAPPPGPLRPDHRDVLAMWHFDYRHDYDTGVLFTVVAGLLNLLVIYDAFVGPAMATEE